MISHSESTRAFMTAYNGMHFRIVLQWKRLTAGQCSTHFDLQSRQLSGNWPRVTGPLWEFFWWGLNAGRAMPLGDLFLDPLGSYSARFHCLITFPLLNIADEVIFHHPYFPGKIEIWRSVTWHFWEFFWRGKNGARTTPLWSLFPNPLTSE